MSDRELFRRTILRYKQEGLQALQGGSSVDEVLGREIDFPGSDVRCGVNLICRPPADIVGYILSVQAHLRTAEPEQYYYSSTNLHLTLFEFCHSRSPEEAALTADGVRPVVERVASGLHPPGIDSPTLVFDSRAVALSFLPADEKLQGFRNRIGEAVVTQGHQLGNRYTHTSAHVTLMRYIRPLRTGPAEWVRHLLNAPDGVGLSWTLTPMWLTWGANWYGMRGRIKEVLIQPLPVEPPAR